MIKCAADVNKAISSFMAFTWSNILPKIGIQLDKVNCGNSSFCPKNLQ